MLVLAAGRGAPVGGQDEGQAGLNDHVLVSLRAESPLATCDPYGCAFLIAPVLQEKSRRLGGKCRRSGVSGTHIVQVICICKTIGHLEGEVQGGVDIILDTHPQGETKGGISVELPIRVNGTSLTLSPKWAEKVFFAIQVSIGIVAEYPKAQRYVGGEHMIRVTGLKLEKVEVSLQGHFPHGCVEAEVTCLLEFVLAIDIRISEAGVMESEAHPDVISHLFPVKCADGHLGPVQCGPVIEVAEIMGHTSADANFPFINCCLRLGPGLKTHEYNEDQ